MRFFTVPVADAKNQPYFVFMQFYIPSAVGAFARLNIDTVHNTPKDAPSWVKQWEEVGLIAWIDKIMSEDYGPGKPLKVS